ncbi:MAG: hypothetical protein GF350_13055, partial [Chitinivibrionales bacterium]|nr:hypothetical protein [Chitinivibrionales bacterium]
MRAAINILVFALSAWSAIYYVSPDGSDSNDGSEGNPFRTFHHARDALRGVSDGEKNVIVKGGDYFLDEPISLDERDNGTAWRGADGEEAWIFGGKKVTGWEAAGGNLYRTQLDLGADISLDTAVWSLSENGRHCRLAQHPNIFEGTMHGVIIGTNADDRNVMRPMTYDPDEVPSDWQDDYHMRSTVAANGWFSQTWPVDNVDFASHVIQLDGRDWSRGSYNLLGAREFIDLPGEWAVTEDGYLYYRPKHTPIENQTIVVGTILRIFEIRGSSPGSPAQNITIEGLNLSTTDCTYRGLSNKQTPTNLGDGNSANCDDDYTRHAIIVLENAEQVTVRHCRIMNAGIMGILLNYHAQNNLIEGNWIEGTNYHGICLQGYCVQTGPWEQINRDNTVRNNFIYRTARLWSNGAGVYLHQSGYNKIWNNEIREMARYALTQKGGYPSHLPACYKDAACMDQYGRTEHNSVRYNDVSHA